MTQQHKELLLKAAALKDNIAGELLCQKIDHVMSTAIYTGEFHYMCGRELKQLIYYFIRDNMDEKNSGIHFTNTKQARKGMTRKQWAEQLLAPLALQINQEHYMTERNN